LGNVALRVKVDRLVSLQASILKLQEHVFTFYVPTAARSVCVVVQSFIWLGDTEKCFRLRQKLRDLSFILRDNSEKPQFFSTLAFIMLQQ
jgi:hypothetical protein